MVEDTSGPQLDPASTTRCAAPRSATTSQLPSSRQLPQEVIWGLGSVLACDDVGNENGDSALWHEVGPHTISAGGFR